MRAGRARSPVRVRDESAAPDSPHCMRLSALSRTALVVAAAALAAAAAPPAPRGATSIMPPTNSSGARGAERTPGSPPPLGAAPLSLGKSLARSAPRLARRLGLYRDGGNESCGQAVQAKYNCSAVGCDDLVPGERPPPPPRGTRPRQRAWRGCLGRHRRRATRWCRLRRPPRAPHVRARARASARHATHARRVLVPPVPAPRPCPAGYINYIYFYECLATGTGAHVRAPTPPPPRAAFALSARHHTRRHARPTVSSATPPPPPAPL